MNYGKAIKTIRAARNLEQKELARRAELNPSYVSLLESNRRSPSTSALEAMAVALEVPVYLITLLASEKQDLRGISENDAGKLGRQLLGAILERED